MRPYTLLDVFTDVPLAGNALAVVHDADGIADATMLAFARETRLAETTFVQTATAPGATYRNRIWTIGGEVPFAGHPSLGTAVAEAILRGDTSASYVQETGAGLQTVEVERDGDLAHASVIQEPAAFGPAVEAGPALAAVGLTSADADPAITPRIVSTGLPTLLLAVRDSDAVRRARPNRGAVAALLPDKDDFNLYLFALDRQAASAHARCFPGFEMEAEDAATGSAAGPLMALAEREAGLRRLVVSQGAELGRPSRIECDLAGDRVRVGGDVVVIATGQVRL